MAQKTNKSYTKRLKVSKHGKIKSRRPGQNHFNAKESRNSQLHKKGVNTFVLNKKQASHLMPGVKITN
jgi:ribosomal protein L35